jgi:hypothetical protein
MEELALICIAPKSWTVNASLQNSAPWNTIAGLSAKVGTGRRGYAFGRYTSPRRCSPAGRGLGGGRDVGCVE